MILTVSGRNVDGATIQKIVKLMYDQYLVNGLAERQRDCNLVAYVVEGHSVIGIAYMVAKWSLNLKVDLGYYFLPSGPAKSVYAGLAIPEIIN